jgi:DNA repair exonuclease SbcCD ATPase subunit
LGTKEDKLDKERQEYLAAKLKYEASQKAINDLEKEIHSLEQQMEPLRSAGDNYHRLLKEKEEILKHQDSETADELLSLADEEGRLAARTKELGEAEEAARHAILSLGELLDSLGSAANWGTWDMIGGGLISTAIKHSKIDHAREKASEVQSALHSLKRELLDVDINTDLAVEIGGLATFADYFFDGLIVDWVVQSRINEARKRAETVMSQVEQIRQNLRLELEETDRKVLELKERKQKLVEQSEV